MADTTADVSPPTHAYNPPPPSPSHLEAIQDEVALRLPVALRGHSHFNKITLEPSFLSSSQVQVSAHRFRWCRGSVLSGHITQPSTIEQTSAKSILNPGSTSCADSINDHWQQSSPARIESTGYNNNNWLDWNMAIDHQRRLAIIWIRDRPWIKIYWIRIRSNKK